MPRFALYFAPPSDDPLSLRATAWLGRDASGAPVERLTIGGLSFDERSSLSASARRYGFHATLKAPFALAAGISQRELESALEVFTGRHAPVGIGRLTLASLDGFLALVPQLQEDELTRFAAGIVFAFEPFRAPLTASERDRRVTGGNLTERHVELLDRYGYPYVEEEFRFHMTLTDRLSEASRPRIEQAARDWFAPVLDRTYHLDRIALFHEAKAGAPFEKLADFPLRAEIAAHV